MNNRILVTGGAGYIGSHTSIMLLEAGYEVVIVDNFCNSGRWIPSRIEELAGRGLRCVELDLRDETQLRRCLDFERPGSVIHFGALKSVGESVGEPLTYYQNNVTGTLNLLEAMLSSGCRNLVFSSSATVYGYPDHCPISEQAPLRAINPYGRTKLIIEDAIRDVIASAPDFRAAILRYFNPAGAHPSGRLGELPKGTPNNLVPFVAQVAAGLRSEVKIFGGDYNTEDGTGVRDYIHVMDLAVAHVKALARLQGIGHSFTVNLGTGRGFSVLEIIKTFSKVCGHSIPYQVTDRRLGDADECYADPNLANNLLGWHAERDLNQICKDAWRWQQYVLNVIQPSQAGTKELD